MLKSAYWPWRRCHFTGFSIFSSCGHFVQQSGTFEQCFSKEHSCEIILKSANWPWRRCRFKSFSIFSSGGHFVQRSGTILAILVKGHPRNIPVKLFWNLPIGIGDDVVKGFFYF